MKGNITLSRPTGTGVDYIEIEIEDNSSGIRFLSARIGYADFAKMLTGLGFIPCEFELRGLDNIGKTVERKTENVYIPLRTHPLVMSDPARRERAEAAIAKYEIDGWTGRVSNALNHHRRISGDVEGEWYKVAFFRFVEAGDEPVYST